MTALKSWTLYVSIYFYIGIVAVMMGLFVVGPSLDWYFNQISYSFPTFERLWVTAGIGLVTATSIGSLVWMRDSIVARHPKSKD